jgi:AcrR family transcriptional regulator
MAAGRPRGFDIDVALEAALGVFLQKGYEGAYLGDLTSAMGINPPSLYAAFGNKEGLFQQVLARYGEERDLVLEHALAAPTASETVVRLLCGSVTQQTLEERPPGCLFVHGALVCADQSDPVRQELVRRRLAGELSLAERFSRARAAGDLPKCGNPNELARYVYAVLYGVAVQAAGGADRGQLLKTVDLAIKAWQGLVTELASEGSL